MNNEDMLRQATEASLNRLYNQASMRPMTQEEVNAMYPPEMFQNTPNSAELEEWAAQQNAKRSWRDRWLDKALDLWELL